VAKQVYRYLEPRALAKIANMKLVARTVVEGFYSGLHRSPYHGFSVEFAEHRAYAPGDSPKDIDWRALARTERYVVKQYEEETNLRAYLLLDISKSMDFHAEGASLTKLQYASYLAACLAYLMIRQRDSVGLVSFSDKIERYLPPRSTTPHLNLMLRELERVEKRSETRVSRAFHDLAEMLKRRSLIIILSDLMDDPKEVVPALRHFRFKRHEVILFHILDRWELDFPFRRMGEFVDMETGERLLVEPRFVRDEYQRQIKEFVEQYKRDCAAGQIEYVLTDTSVPYDFMLSAYLAKRKRIQ